MLVDERGEPRQRIRNGEKFSKARSWRTTLVPSDDPIKVSTIRWLFQTYADTDTGMRSLADQLNAKGVPGPTGGPWYSASIKAMLENRNYTGTQTWAKRREGKYHSVAAGQIRKLHLHFWAISTSAYPASRAAAQIHLFAHDKHGCVGRIWLTVAFGAADVPATAMIDRVADEIRKHGGNPEAAFSFKGQPSDQFHDAIVCATSTETNADLAVFSLLQKKQDIDVSLTILCPTWRASGESWSRCKRTAEMVRETLRLPFPTI